MIFLLLLLLVGVCALIKDTITKYRFLNKYDQSSKLTNKRVLLFELIADIIICTFLITYIIYLL